MTIEEARSAYRVGVKRHRNKSGPVDRHRFGWKPDAKTALRTDGMSAMSEYFVALETGREWLSSGLVPDAPDDGDVAGGISVRWTALEHGCLIVHEDEKDHLRCVLVVGPNYPLRIVGWVHAHEAKNPQFWKTNVRFPAYFVRPWRDIRLLQTDEGSGSQTCPQCGGETEHGDDCEFKC